MASDSEDLLRQLYAIKLKQQECNSKRTRLSSKDSLQQRVFMLERELESAKKRLNDIKSLESEADVLNDEWKNLDAEHFRLVQLYKQTVPQNKCGRCNSLLKWSDRFLAYHFCNCRC